MFEWTFSSPGANVATREMGNGIVGRLHRAWRLGLLAGDDECGEMTKQPINKPSIVEGRAGGDCYIYNKVRGEFKAVPAFKRVN